MIFGRLLLLLMVGCMITILVIILKKTKEGPSSLDILFAVSVIIWCFIVLMMIFVG